jgi:hypothetical protein
MACLGVHFAITADVVDRLTQDHPPGNAAVIAWHEGLNRQFDALHVEGWVAMTENAWDGIHRSLTDGKLDLGKTPRYLCVLGATERYWIMRGDRQLEYIVTSPSACKPGTCSSPPAKSSPSPSSSLTLSQRAV